MTDDTYIPPESEVVGNQALEEEQQDANNHPLPAKVARGVFKYLGCGMLQLILAIVCTPLGFFLLYDLIFQPKIEIVFPKNYETQKNVSCCENYVKKWGKWVLTGEISFFRFYLKDGADEEAGLFAYEGDLHVRVNGKKHHLVNQGKLDESVILIERNLKFDQNDSSEERGRKWGLSLAKIILSFFNTEIKIVEGVPEAVVSLPLIAIPEKEKAARLLVLDIEDSKDTVEFSIDGQNWHSLPFPTEQIEGIFGPMLDEAELNRREKLQQQKADKLKAEWKKWLEAAEKGKEKIDDVKEKLDQGKEKIEQGKALLEKGKNLLNKKEDEHVPEP